MMLLNQTPLPVVLDVKQLIEVEDRGCFFPVCLCARVCMRVRARMRAHAHFAFDQVVKYGVEHTNTHVHDAYMHQIKASEKASLFTSMICTLNYTQARVLGLDETGNRVKVHFIGWSDRNDKSLSCSSNRIRLPPSSTNDVHDYVEAPCMVHFCSSNPCLFLNVCARARACLRGTVILCVGHAVGVPRCLS